MSGNIYIYILVMAAVTYLLRMLPLVVFKKPIKNRFFRSFLYYVPYVTLSVMSFPAIIEATGNRILGTVAFILSMVLSYAGLSLPMTALVSFVAVYAIHFVF
jgi:Branched-chain amino acid transport protein (AzlD).